MAIPFTCPHCGKQMSVPDQYAGQTGPCQACGKTITIPGAPHFTTAGAGSYQASAPPKSGGGGTTIFIIVGVVMLFGLLLIGCVAGLMFPALNQTREAARRMQSTNNMKQILLALHNYHDANQRFPPAVVRDADGNPLYSGRVLLLPYLERLDLYTAWQKDQPWNSPANMAISQMDLPIFRDPSSTGPTVGQTDYLFITGPGSGFEELKDGSTRLADFVDGTANTIILMEVKGSGVNWAEPRDIDIGNVWPQQGNYPKVILVGFADGSVRALSQGTNPQTVKGLATRNGNEPVTGDY